jgi:hypothetical protein
LPRLTRAKLHEKLTAPRERGRRNIKGRAARKFAEAASIGPIIQLQSAFGRAQFSVA